MLSVRPDDNFDSDNKDYGGLSACLALIDARYFFGVVIVILDSTFVFLTGLFLLNSGKYICKDSISD